MIQWVHRPTRGWSYGASIRDSRTQEIIKGHVTLGSLRVRRDYFIAEGLLAPYDEDPQIDRLKAFALARIWQLWAMKWGTPWVSRITLQRVPKIARLSWIILIE